MNIQGFFVSHLFFGWEADFLLAADICQSTTFSDVR